MSTTPPNLAPVGVETIPGPDGQANYYVERTVEPEWVLPASGADGEYADDSTLNGLPSWFNTNNKVPGWFDLYAEDDWDLL